MGGHAYERRSAGKEPLQDSVRVLAAINEEIDRQAQSPPSEDPTIGAMWQAYAGVVESEPLLRSVVEAFVAKKPVMTEQWSVEGVPVSEVVGNIRMALQYDCVWHGRLRFPATPRGWTRLMRGIVGDPERLAVFDMVLTNHTPRTCSGERYGPVEVVRQMDGDLSGEGAGFWDGGSSVQAGVNQMQLKHLFPFPLARLLFPDGSPDDQATAGYADCIGRPAIGGDFVTSDLLPPDDRVARMLALASMRPSEITDASFRSRFLGLAHAKLPNVHFIQGDITDKNAVDAIRRRRDALGLGPARIAFLGTVLDQLGQGRVAQGIRNAMSLVGNGGKLIIAEFGQPDRRDPRRFSLLPHWGRYTYGYFAVHKDDGDGVIHPLIKFETSRPINGRVDGGLLDICGQLLPYREHLARAAGAAVTLRSVVRQPALSTLP